ncbi:Plasma membrane t-SNARE, secretory vesicle fusion [Irineochytrium annulatum]|nr:Plasma membrane t-SNARE, secretory vesicle fusion [Irineochytrium annulatum]
MLIPLLSLVLLTPSTLSTPAPPSKGPPPNPLLAAKPFTKALLRDVSAQYYLCTMNSTTFVDPKKKTISFGNDVFNRCCFGPSCNGPPNGQCGAKGESCSCAASGGTLWTASALAKVADGTSPHICEPCTSKVVNNKCSVRPSSSSVKDASLPSSSSSVVAPPWNLAIDPALDIRDFNSNLTLINMTFIESDQDVNFEFVPVDGASYDAGCNVAAYFNPAASSSAATTTASTTDAVGLPLPIATTDTAPIVSVTPSLISRQAPVSSCVASTACYCAGVTPTSYGSYISPSCDLFCNGPNLNVVLVMDDGVSGGGFTTGYYIDFIEDGGLGWDVDAATFVETTADAGAVVPTTVAGVATPRVTSRAQSTDDPTRLRHRHHQPLTMARNRLNQDSQYRDLESASPHTAFDGNPTPAFTQIPLQPSAPQIPSEIHGLAQFQSAVDALHALCSSVDASLASCSTLSSKLASESNPSALDDMTARLDAQMSQTRSQIDAARAGLESLKRSKGGDPAQRQSSFESVARRVRSCAQNFFGLQQQVQAARKARLAREYRIVRPEASEEEVRRVVESGGGGVSVFDTTAAVGAQRAQLDQAEERRRELVRIGKGMEELLALTQELESMINQQQVWVDEIEVKVQQTGVYVIEANTQLDIANKSAEGARSKKQYVCIIVTVVLVVLAAAIGIYVYAHSKSNTNKNNGAKNEVVSRIRVNFAHPPS